MATLTIREEVVRTIRLAVQALGASEWNTGHDQIDGDMESAIGDARMALCVCDNQEDGCCNKAKWRYALTARPGLKTEKYVHLSFCDDCWGGDSATVYQICQGCSNAIQSDDGLAVMPDHLLSISKIHGDEIVFKREACEGVFHERCGRVCSACCSLVARVAGSLPEIAIRKVAGIEGTQLVCFDCRGALKDDEFISKNAAILEPSKVSPDLVRIKPGMRAGVRRAVREDGQVAEAPKAPAGQKRAIEAAPAPKKRTAK